MRALLLLAIACSVVLAGAPSAAAPPFTSHRLSNGLTVLLSPSPAHPVVALSAFVTTGGRTEDEHYQGSLHYIEHLVYKGGTPNMKPTEFRKKVSTIGRESGGWTWDDEINFGFEVPKENFPEALAIFHEALHDLRFEEQWFEDEKRVVLQEMQQGREEPSDALGEAWEAIAFAEHPYGRSVIGTQEAILGLEMHATEKYYRDRFTPNHMIVSVAGDFEEKEMLAQLEKAWGKDAKGPEDFELGIVEPAIRGPRRRVEFLPQATSGMLQLGVVTPGGADADAPALALLAEILGDPSVGLPQYLERQEPWVSNVSASHYAMRDFGQFNVNARMDPAKEAAVEAFLEDFLVTFDVTKLPPETIESARRALLAGEERGRDTAAKRAERLGFLASRSGVEGAAAWADRLGAVTAAEIQAAKERHLVPRRFVTSVVFPESFDPDSAAVAKVTPRAPERPPLLSLDAPGALQPPAAAPLAFETSPAVDGVTKLTFANGLCVLIRPTSATSLVAISGRMLGGQWVEPAGQVGINRFTAELGLASTRRWNEEGFQRYLASLGATASTHVSVGSRANTSRNVDYRDAGAHHYNGLATQWKELLACLKESMFFPAFDTAEVERVRADLLTEIGAIEENQLELLKQEFYIRAYSGHPYGNPTVGTKESITSIRPSDLAKFHESAWTPDRCVIAIVGDVRADEVGTWIAAHWADVPARRAGPVATTAPTGWTFDPPDAVQTLERGRDYWTVNWGKPGVAYGAPKWWPSTVLSQVAGNDHFYKYVYGEGVSYRSWVRFWPNLGSGTWILENDVKRERFDEILGMFQDDLARYASKGFTQQEFDDAVQRLVNSKILDAQTNSILAWNLAVTEGNGVGFTAETKAVENLRAVEYDGDAGAGAGGVPAHDDASPRSEDRATSRSASRPADLRERIPPLRSPRPRLRTAASRRPPGTWECNRRALRGRSRFRRRAPPPGTRPGPSARESRSGLPFPALRWRGTRHYESCAAAGCRRESECGSARCASRSARTRADRRPAGSSRTPRRLRPCTRSGEPLRRD